MQTPQTLTRRSGASRRRPDPSNDTKKGEKSAFEILGGEKNQHPCITYTPGWLGSGGSPQNLRGVCFSVCPQKIWPIKISITGWGKKIIESG